MPGNGRHFKQYVGTLVPASIKKTQCSLRDIHNLTKWNALECCVCKERSPSARLWLSSEDADTETPVKKSCNNI